MAEPLAITVYSDVICPWCYVGKRRLEAALGAPGAPGRRCSSPGGRSSSIPTCPLKASRARSTGCASSAPSAPPNSTAA